MVHSVRRNAVVTSSRGYWGIWMTWSVGGTEVTSSRAVLATQFEQGKVELAVGKQVAVGCEVRNC